ncbi:MAG: FKBP-type peptidyl-prolyl cis-trans isomerase [Spirochaetales bacterium]|nr:FKBP-type peptidyl-prolyl cis-trans isomerase [Spirochaetales bacterium]
MKRVLVIALIFCTGFCLLASAADTSALAAMAALPAPTDLDSQFSYVYGLLVIQSILQSYPDLDIAYWGKGIYDALNGEMFFTTAQMQQILTDYQMMTLEANAEAQRKLAQENLKLAEDFLKINKTQQGVYETASGLQYQILREGTGEKPGPNSNVRVDYELTLLDGSVIDSSYNRKVPSDFNLNAVITGFSEGLQLMKVGSKFRFFIHPKLGYGESGSSAIEPNTLLIFEVELLAINN